MPHFVKICGITRLADAAAAVEAGADALGFVAYERSPRHAAPDVMAFVRAAFGKQSLSLVCVSVDAPVQSLLHYAEAGADVFQLHGVEDAAYASELMQSLKSNGHTAKIWKAIRPRSCRDVSDAADFPCDAYLVDAYSASAHGGTGMTSDWDAACFAVSTLGRPVILAGGLSHGNVAEAIQVVSPFGVDASSSLESSPGVKIHSLITSFVTTVKSMRLAKCDGGILTIVKSE